MTSTVTFAAAAVSAFQAAVAGLEQATSISAEKQARLEKILSRIEADSKLIARVLSFGTKAKSAGLEAHVIPGAVVTFNYGRGDTARTLQGVVTAVRSAEGKVPPAAKVRVGSGFDEELLSIHPQWVTAVEGVAQEQEESEAEQLSLLDAQEAQEQEQQA